MPKLSRYRNQSIDLQSRSTDWFLYDGNFGIDQICLLVWMMPHVETLSNHSKLCNFIILWKMIKKAMNLCRRFFLHKNLTHKYVKKGGNVIYICGDDTTYLKFKTCKFITLWKIMKMQQNFLEGSLSIKFIKIYKKQR